MKRLLGVLLSSALILAAACSAPGQPSGRELPGLPMEAPRHELPRNASNYAFQSADLVDSQSAWMTGSDLQLGVSGLSWAILGIETGGQVPSLVTISGTIQSRLYLAVGNYEKGRWEWLGEPLNAAGSRPLPASGTLSPGGAVYIALVCPDGDSASITVDIDITLAPSAWNLLVWFAADNDLAQEAVDNLNELESVGSTPELRLLAGFDIDPEMANPGISGIDQVRFIKVVNDTDDNAIKIDGDPANQAFPRAGYNSADPAHMVEFADWAAANFPASNTALVIWDHGDGWRPGWKGASGIMGDDHDGDFLLTDNAYIAETLGTRHFDLLAFDACNMAHLEALYEYRGSADWLVASEVLFPGHGFPYALLVQGWQAAQPLTAQAAAQAIVDAAVEYYTGNESMCLAVIKSSELDALGASLQALAADVTAKAEVERDGFQQAESQAEAPFFGDGERDLQSFLTTYRGLTADTGLQLLIDDALAKLDAANVYFGQADEPGLTGIPAYLPDSDYFSQDYQNDYAPLAYNQATGWLAMLQAIGVTGWVPVTADWVDGDKLEITWPDNTADVDLSFEDPLWNFGGPWDPTELIGIISFSVDNPDGGGTFEWGRLLPGGASGEYIASIDYFPPGNPEDPPYEDVTIKLYDSGDNLKQDFGVCRLNQYEYLDLGYFHHE